jgi:hypothetical protein
LQRDGKLVLKAYEEKLKEAELQAAVPQEVTLSDSSESEI